MKKFVSPYGSPTRRFVVLLVLVIFTFILLGRILYIQVYNADFFLKQGNARFIRDKKEPAIRGIIKDRNNNPLAVSTPVSSIWVNPKEINLNPKAIDLLVNNLKLSKTDIITKLKKYKSRTFLYIKRGVNPEIAKEIEAQKIVGIHSLVEYKRYYPSAEATAQIIGFNNIDDKGQEGIELMYDNSLTGIAGSSKIIRDTAGKVVDILQEITPPVKGEDIKLTIDKRIQFLTYQALLETNTKFSAKTSTAVVLDAKTSEILAMVSVPSGNPNNPDEKITKLVKNRAITDVFEPGSTLKPIAIATALDIGAVRSNTIIDSNPGNLVLGKYTVKDIHNYGKRSVLGVIQKSSNVGTCKIALRVPKTTMHSYYYKAGFGQLSKIRFPGEQRGFLNKFKRLSDFEYCTNSYGYGISVNTLQLAEAYAILANDGVKIDASIVFSDVEKKKVRVFSKSTARKVRKMIKAAVEIGGTGTRATKGDLINEYTVGGKTGTIHKAVNGHYLKHSYYSAFVGMAPINNPRIVMAVIVDDPKGDKYYGGLVAAPVFAKVVGKALRIMNVKPDRPANQQTNNP